MSTSDKWTNDYSLCPCGKGKIIQHVDSPDNPWSRTTYEYSIECLECNSKYVLVDKEIRDRQAYGEAQGYLHSLCDIEDELSEICKEAIEKILKDKGIKDPSIEHGILVSAGICSEGPIRYPRFRRAGTPASDLCQPLDNVEWIIENLSDQSKANMIFEKKRAMDHYKSGWDKAKEKGKPISIESLRKL